MKLGEGEDEQFVEAAPDAIPTEAVETLEGVECFDPPAMALKGIDAVMVSGGVGAVGDARLSWPRFRVARLLKAAAAGSFKARGGDGDCCMVAPGAAAEVGVCR